MKHRNIYRHNLLILLPNNSGPKFDKFDYGWFENRMRYGQPRPPAYNLDKVTVPVHMFHGVNDIISSPKVFELKDI